MTTDSTMRNARIAGAAYFLFLPAPISLIYIPSKLIVRGDAAATAERILAHQTLFRFGIVNEVLVALLWVFVALALYRFLNGVNQTLAVLMVIFGPIFCVPLSMLNVVNELAALMLLRAPAYLSVLSQQQLQAMALFFLDVYNSGIVIQMILWGVWLIPFGLLLYKSRFVPRFLGILLLINGATYLVVSLALLFASPYASVLNQWAFIPEMGELVVAFWLLIKGAKGEPAALRMAAATA